jgi:hypothetical protein
VLIEGNLDSPAVMDQSGQIPLQVVSRDQESSDLLRSPKGACDGFDWSSSNPVEVDRTNDVEVVIHEYVVRARVSVSKAKTIGKLAICVSVVFDQSWQRPIDKFFVF